MNYLAGNNKKYKSEIECIIDKNKSKIFSFFEKEEFDLNINVYIYDKVEELVLGLENRGFVDNPSYMCACQKDEDNSLNFFEPKDNPNSDEWSKEEYEHVIVHELIHAIEFNIYG